MDFIADVFAVAGMRNHFEAPSSPEQIIVLEVRVPSGSNCLVPAGAEAYFNPPRDPLFAVSA